MKTHAFLIRAAICCLIALIPMSELENRIYSGRLHVRGQWRQPSAQEVVIVETDETSLTNPEDFRRLRSVLIGDNPAEAPDLVLVATGQSIPGDPDGVIRHTAWVRRNGDPSLAFFIAKRRQEEGATLSIPTTEEDLRERRLIDFAGPGGSVPRCRVYASRVPCGDVRGKILLLTGITGSSSVSYLTPLGPMSSAEILANEITTLAYDHPIRTAPYAAQVAIIAFAVLVGAFAIVYLPVMVSAPVLAGTGLAIVLLLFQAIFQLGHLYLPAANFGFALLVTYLVFTGYRLAFQESLQWRTLKQAQYLRELEELKSNFISLLSHDLKTPIAKIQAVTERLRRELATPAEDRAEVTKAWPELLRSIENSGKELNHYVTSVLNLSRIESQKITLNRKSNDINFLIEQVLRRLQPLATERKIHVKKELEPLFSVECDEDLMKQVLTNLVDNAIKYSPEGATVTIRSREEEGFIRVEVEDSGPGIPQSQLPLMFRKFSRLTQATADSVKGTGLGLYLSKYFIELHGGRIQLKSTVGTGTTFTFTLPIAASEKSPQPG